MNYEFNLLHHVGVVAKRVRATAAETAAAHEGNKNTPSGPTGRGVKNRTEAESIAPSVSPTVTAGANKNVDMLDRSFM